MVNIELQLDVISQSTNTPIDYRFFAPPVEYCRDNIILIANHIRKILSKPANQVTFLKSLEYLKEDLMTFISQLDISDGIDCDITTQISDKYDSFRNDVEYFPSLENILFVFNKSRNICCIDSIKDIICLEYALSLEVVKADFHELYKQVLQLLLPSYSDIAPKEDIRYISIDNSNITRDLFKNIKEGNNLKNMNSEFKIDYNNIVNITFDLDVESGKRTELQNLLDIYVYNAIHSIFYQGRSNYITLKQIKTQLLGDKRDVTSNQQKMILDSINYLNNIWIYICYSNIADNFDNLKDNRKNDIRMFLDSQLDNNYAVKERLINVSYTGYRTNNGFIAEAIKLIQPSTPYVFARALNQLVGVNLDMLQLANSDHQRVNDINMLSSLYVCHFVQSKNMGIDRRTKKRNMLFSTIFSRLNLTDLSNQAIKNTRCDVHRHVKYIFNVLKDENYIKWYQNDTKKIMFC